MCDVQSRFERMRWTFRVFGFGVASVSCWSLSIDNSNSTIDLQGKSFSSIHAQLRAHFLNCVYYVCFQTCARVMLKDQDKVIYGRRLLNPNLSYLAKKSIASQILVKSKKHTKCPYCGSINGPIKKGPGLMKILHEPFRGKKPTDPIMSETLHELLESTAKNRELNQIIGPAALISEMNPLQVLDLFKRIPKSDIPLLGMTSENSNPANLIVTRVFVPPVCIRPSVMSEIKAGTTEDDLTMKQSEILLINDVINKHMNTGGKMELIQEDWDFLQLHVSLYFNSEVSGIPIAMLVSDKLNTIRNPVPTETHQ